MKAINYLLLLSIILFSCKEEENPEPEPEPVTYGTLKVNIIGKHGSDDFVMYSEYTPTGQPIYRIEGLKFYVSNIGLDAKKSDDVFLLNFVNNHLSAGSEGESFSVELETGSYDALKFSVGLDNETNHGDPSLYPQESPLSSFNDTHWDWAQGYKFFMTDGKIDSDSDNVPDQSFSYHIGNDDYLQNIVLNTPLSITEGQTTEIDIYFDVEKVFENVDVNTNSFTHSTSNFELVEKIATNYANAFSF